MSRVSHWIHVIIIIIVVVVVIIVIVIIVVVVVMCHWLLKIMILYRWSSTKLTGELAFKSVPQDAPALLPPQTSLPFFAFLSNRAKFFIRMCPSEKVWSLEEGVCSGIWTGGGGPSRMLPANDRLPSLDHSIPPWSLLSLTFSLSTGPWSVVTQSVGRFLQFRIHNCVNFLTDSKFRSRDARA